MTTTTKKTPAKKTPAKKTTPAKILSVSSDAFAKQYYPNAKYPAKTLRKRLRNMIVAGHADLIKLLVEGADIKYAIPDTKTARDKFTSIMS